MLLLFFIGIEDYCPNVTAQIIEMNMTLVEELHTWIWAVNILDCAPGFAWNLSNEQFGQYSANLTCGANNSENGTWLYQNIVPCIRMVSLHSAVL